MGSIGMAEEFLNPTNIKIVGIGGAGCNTINRMIDSGFKGVDFIALNTDVQSINTSKATHKIQIGAQLTKGLGTGANAELGREAALESKDAIRESISGAHLVFITAGMGGGTGTGASPVVAEIAKELGILTIAFVTRPFVFEGKKRMEQAQEGVKKIQNYVDSLLVIQNQKLMDAIEDKNISLMGAFEKVDEVLMQGIQGIADIINKTGIVNVDFADVRVIMQASGMTLMGFGRSSGKDRALVAVNTALNNPLLDLDISGAGGILINISAGKSLSLMEYHQIVELITSKASDDANIIAGAFIDEEFAEQLCVTVIATHFQNHYEKEEKKPVLTQISTPEPSLPIADTIAHETPAEIESKEEEQPMYEKESFYEEDTIFGKNMPATNISFNSKALLDKNKEKQESKGKLFLTKRDTIKIFDEDFQLGKLDIPAFQRRGM